MKMKKLNPDERPREKMLLKGAETLSNSELIAIILRSGTPEENAMDLSRHLLSFAGGNLSGLFSMTLERMSEIKGLGPCKSTSVMAALELGKRFYREGSGTKRIPVTTPGMAYDLMHPIFKGLTREECWVLFLNRSNYVTDKCRITSGCSDSTVMDVKEIVRLALDKKSSALILTHNHPSGNPRPSEADMKFTKELHDAASLFHIALLDHIVVCDDSFFSFSEDRICSPQKGRNE